MATHKVKINRAPVLTLWAAVVAERLGYDRDAALTLGKAAAGLNAQSKGRRLGIYEERTPEEREKEERKRRERRPDEEYMVPVLGRGVPAVDTEHGVRATAKGKPIEPGSVRRYLEKKFGEALPEVQAAMEELAAAYEPNRLASRAYDLYERFRPSIPAGKKGWGAEGELDLELIRSLGE
jgi:hypothetical protein